MNAYIHPVKINQTYLKKKKPLTIKWKAKITLHALRIYNDMLYNMKLTQKPFSVTPIFSCIILVVPLLGVYCLLVYRVIRFNYLQEIFFDFKKSQSELISSIQ